MRKTHPSVQHANKNSSLNYGTLTDIKAKTDNITVTGAVNLDNMKTEVDALPVGLSGYEARITALEAKNHISASISFVPDATSPSVENHLNASTLTRIALGKYRITFDTAMSSADYVVTTGCETTNGKDCVIGVVARATGYVDVGLTDIPNENYTDNPNAVFVTIREI